MSRPGSSFVIGIDFGTTYSGAAWAWSARPGDHRVVNRWDGLGTRQTSGKVPTRILYTGDVIKWGFNISPEEKPIEWFKLLLLQPKDMKLVDDKRKYFSYIEDARKELRRLNKSAEDVVADYLKLLWQHILADMKREFGEATVDSQPFRVVMTYPAIWPLYAQSRLTQAATMAGIKDARDCGETDLKLCAEPEAAALAVMEDGVGASVDSGDIFIVCDVGGGTADLITYELLDTDTEEVAECATGAGKLCGAIFVDEAFDQKMSEWMTPRKWKKYDETSKREWKEQNWESGLKRNFTGADQELQLILPLELRVNDNIRFSNLFSRGAGKLKPKIRNHRLQLQRQDIASIFDVCVDQIVALVQEQIRRTRENRAVSPKAIFLVGGFGQNVYLYNKLREAISFSVEIRVPSDNKAWTAVCRGALIRATISHDHEGGGIMRGPTVSSRMARSSYGIEIIEPFDPNVHRLEDKEYVPSVDADCAMNQMHWYIRANETIDDQTVIKLDWSKKIRTPLRGNGFTVILWRCDRSVPPSRKDADVRQEGVINCTVRTPFEQLPQYTNTHGEVWRALDFQVEMKPQGTMLEFVVHYNGTRQRPLQVHPPFTSAGESGVPPSAHPTALVPVPPNYAPPPPPIPQSRTVSRRNSRPISTY